MTVADKPKPKSLIKQFHIVYYRRGRYVGITPCDADGEPLGAEIQLPLNALFKSAGVTREEAMMAIEEAGTPDAFEQRQDADINPEWDELRLKGIPANLTGKTVLDIGGYNGEWAKVCLDRGARQAICYDSGQFTDYGWARPKLAEGVIFQRGDLMDFGWRPPRPADVVIFYNVLYHIRDPWSALERVRLLTKETLVLCTSFVPGDEAAFKLYAFDDPNEHPINDTYTAYWRPTVPGLFKLLRLTGFRDITEVGRSGDHVVVTAH